MAERIMQSNIKKIATIVLIFFAWLVLVKGTAMAASNISTGETAKTTAAKVPLENMNKKFFIPETQIASLQESALKGDTSDANKLYDFYVFYKNNYDEGMYWVTIAAENGDVRAMYNLADLSTILAGKKGKIRARFWFEKVIASGQMPLAADAKKRIEEMDAKKGSGSHK